MISLPATRLLRITNRKLFLINNNFSMISSSFKFTMRHWILVKKIIYIFDNNGLEVCREMNYSMIRKIKDLNNSLLKMLNKNNYNILVERFKKGNKIY